MPDQAPPQCLTVKYEAITLILHNQLHISPAFDLSTTPQPWNPQTCGAKEFRAIWDTGATNTAVSPAVIQQCGLKPIGMTQVETAAGTIESSVYLASIFLPNLVVFASTRVTEVTLRDADVLIGMDIISQGDFAITCKDKRTTFSFRLPSVQTIDFVQAENASRLLRATPVSPDPSRSAPCPCGSGKKYKRCCGA